MSDGEQLELDHYSSDTWTFQNTLFGIDSYLNWSGVDPDADFNGYMTNVTRLKASATHDVTNLVFSFDTGPLGQFYLPTAGPATNLFNTGRTYASNVGLYHFTTTTNQWKESNSFVDIGFHSIALGTNGLPMDTDGDGVADYLEDLNGDGLVGISESVF